MNTNQKINEYIKSWKSRGYPIDIPDEIPDVLINLNLAPSYKSIALAILKNDMQMESLGFQPKKSNYYNILKKIEISEREKNGN